MDSHLSLLAFIKEGPCLRNSVVSPNRGHPIVPGGNPFFRYLSSFHLSKQVHSNNTPNIRPTMIPKITIFALSSVPPVLCLVYRETELLVMRQNWVVELSHSISFLFSTFSFCFEGYAPPLYRLVESPLSISAI